MEPTATEILASKAFKDAVLAADQRVKDAWAATEDREEREKLWLQLRADKSLVRELRISAERRLHSNRAGGN